MTPKTTMSKKIKIIYPNEEIINYLRNKDFVSPTQIGEVVGGLDYDRASGWASPKCLRLVKMGLLKRNKRGWYKSL